MPRRKSTRRVDAESVQGDGAWVELRAVTYGTYKQYRRWDSDDDALDDVAIRDHVIGWNWVDDDGEPLPLPDSGDDALDVLTISEKQFLIAAIFEQEELLKNSATTS